MWPFSKRRRPTAESRDPSTLGQTGALELLGGAFTELGERDITHVIVALSQCSKRHLIEFGSAVEADNVAGNYPAGWSGVAKFYWQAYLSAHDLVGLDGEISSRLSFYMFLAAMLRRFDDLPDTAPDLVEKWAALWVSLLRASETLRHVVNETKLWPVEMIVAFRDLDDESCSRFVRDTLLPERLRSHPEIRQWDWRGIDDQGRADIERTMRGLSG